MVDFTPLVRETLFFLSFLGVYIILALALNLHWGYTGVFNIGVAAFWALGAYTSAILTSSYVPPSNVTTGHWGFSQPYIVGLLGAMVVSAGAAVLIAVPTVRLRADYFAIASLGLAEIIRLFLIQLESVTGGTIGIRNIPKPITIGSPFDPTSILATQVVFVGISAAFILAVFLFLEFVGRSPWGRVLKAIREDEDAALALGKDTFRYKVQAFAIGAAIMGLAGSLYAHFITFIEPQSTFTPFDTFIVWTMVIVGGSGNNRGVILGALALWSFEFITIRLEGPLSGVLPEVIVSRLQFIRLMAVGLILLLLVLMRPQGLLGERRVISKLLVRG